MSKEELKTIRECMEILTHKSCNYQTTAIQLESVLRRNNMWCEKMSKEKAKQDYKMTLEAYKDAKKSGDRILMRRLNEDLIKISDYIWG